MCKNICKLKTNLMLRSEKKKKRKGKVVHEEKENTLTPIEK